jgi:hypothetical protein
MDTLHALARLTGTHDGSALDRIIRSVGAILAPFAQLREPRRDQNAQTVYLIRRDYRPIVRQDGSLWVELHGDTAAPTLSDLKRNSGDGYSSKPVHSLAELRDAIKSLQPAPTHYSTWRDMQPHPLSELFV